MGKYGLLLIGFGMYPMLAGQRAWANGLGKSLVALGLVFTGLEFMSGAFTLLRTDENFISYLHLFSADSLPSILACVLVACLLTMIVQSSSAMLGITMTLATTGVIDFDTAVALIIGENIGTTIMAPEVSLQQAEMEMDNMVVIVRELFDVTREYLTAPTHNKKHFERINHLEDITDNIEEEMINFITVLLTGPVTHK